MPLQDPIRGDPERVRAHSAVFFAISLTEKVRPNGSREVDECIKLHIWTTFEQNLPMDPGDNPRNVLK